MDHQTKVKEKNKNDRELYQADFETEEEFRGHIAELADEYARENNVSLTEATKLMYAKYKERGDE